MGTLIWDDDLKTVKLSDGEEVVLRRLSYGVVADMQSKVKEEDYATAAMLMAIQSWSYKTQDGSGMAEVTTDNIRRLDATIAAEIATAVGELNPLAVNSEA